MIMANYVCTTCIDMYSDPELIEVHEIILYVMLPTSMDTQAE